MLRSTSAAFRSGTSMSEESSLAELSTQQMENGLRLEILVLKSIEEHGVALGIQLIVKANSRPSLLIPHLWKQILFRLEAIAIKGGGHR